MIAASTAFSSANALLNKKPIYIFQAGKYPFGLAFSNSSSIPFVFSMLGIGGLCGAFTDGTGAVIEILEVGDGMNVVVPVGATQLQLGVNHDEYFLNSGSFVVSINGTHVTVPATACPWNWVRGGLNNAYIYGLGAAINSTGPGFSPGPFVAATGLTAGQSLSIQYVSGLVNCFTLGFGFTNVGPLGDPAFITGNFAQLNDDYPTIYMNTPVKSWLVNLDDLKLTINDLAGSSDLSNLVATAQDYLQGITSAIAIQVYEGEPARLLSGFEGMTIIDFLTLFTGVVDTIESDNYNLEYKFTCPSRNARKLAQTVYTIGDDGFPTDSKHPKSLLGHPMDLLVSVLQQCGVSSIDTAKIYYYRDTIFNGLLYEFSLTSAPIAKDFIESEILKPMGMYWRETNLGTITITSFYPALSGNGTYTPPVYPQATLDSSVITDVPVEKIAGLVDQVKMSFDDNGSGFDAESVQTWTAAVNKYGLVGVQIIESKGMRSAFQGYFMAAIISRLISLRYGSKQIVLDPLPLFWNMCILEPGDIIAVTLAYLPDRQAGVLGVTTKAFEVLDRNWRFMSGICEVKLLEINLAAFKQFLITPNGEPDFAADTAPNQAKYMYLCNAAGKYSTGASGNTLG